MGRENKVELAWQLVASFHQQGGFLFPVDHVMLHLVQRNPVQSIPRWSRRQNVLVFSSVSILGRSLKSW